MCLLIQSCYFSGIVQFWNMSKPEASNVQFLAYLLNFSTFRLIVQKSKLWKGRGSGFHKGQNAGWTVERWRAMRINPKLVIGQKKSGDGNAWAPLIRPAHISGPTKKAHVIAELGFLHYRLSLGGRLGTGA